MMLGFSNSTCTAIYTEHRLEWKGNKTNPSVWIYLVPESLKEVYIYVNIHKLNALIQYDSWTYLLQFHLFIKCMLKMISGI